MPYPLQQLLIVREHREESAALELLQRRQAVTTAQEHLQRCQQELHDYIQWRVKRESDLYQEIMQKLIPLRELDDVKAKVQMLRIKEVTYQENVLAAQRALEDAKKAVEVAHAQYLSCVKNRQKLDEHKSHWLREEAREVEYKQELELEDFRVRSDDDWDVTD